LKENRGPPTKRYWVTPTVATIKFWMFAEEIRMSAN